MILKELLTEKIDELKGLGYELIKVNDVEKLQGVIINLSPESKLDNILNDKPVKKFLGFTVVHQRTAGDEYIIDVRESAELNGFYYYFDSIGVIFELDGYDSNFIHASAFADDKAAIKYGANYEATVIKYEYKNGEKVNYTVLYEPY